jgi:hypothetical protein
MLLPFDDYCTLWLIRFQCRFDCVFPTRTARFGVALITTGSLKLKGKELSEDLRPVDPHCGCSTCRHYSRAALHVMFKENSALAAQLLTKHNVSYMMRLMRTMRQSIMDGPAAFEQYVRSFFAMQFPDHDVPLWVVDALKTADIEIATTVSRTASETAVVDSTSGEPLASEVDSKAEHSTKKLKL